MTELCDCPDEHFATADGRCDNPPLWHDDADTLDHKRYSQCGCCMADCPDVHLEPKPIRAVPGSLQIAAEHVATLPRRNSGNCGSGRPAESFGSRLEPRWASRRTRSGFCRAP
ncbi:hypothetical protein MMAGJ_73110 [Mycolicibacterium mageritense]|uniref:4Fe-4S ferredoxin-type domain-containing protein n=1 Tax=Mycolicibacterium mageritense TaxID=53462 RepID=A0ABM7I541_MYCME|nr:hypothetical protein MMAGJ_73110 [Mycolicibacterium mageritense]